MIFKTLATSLNPTIYLGRRKWALSQLSSRTFQPPIRPIHSVFSWVADKVRIIRGQAPANISKGSPQDRINRLSRTSPTMWPRSRYAHHHDHVPEDATSPQHRAIDLNASCSVNCGNRRAPMNGLKSVADHMLITGNHIGDDTGRHTQPSHR